MIKYQFKIRTRRGMIVDNVTIAGRDQPDAQRKLLQMYPECEVLAVTELELQTRPEPTDIDSIISLITKQDTEPGKPG
ncbi:MAG: hypothetical protein ACKVQA_15760 [Burkholderiales bacterium]